MKKICYLILFLFLISCGSKIKIKNYNPNIYFDNINEPDSIFVVEQKKVASTSNKGEYLYINGFRNYDFKKSETIKDKDSIYVNKLNFYRTYSSFYTRKLMYEKFGNWDKSMFLKGERTPFLIWEKVKLFSNEDNYYYVIAGGLECTTCNDSVSIYSSIMVLDENRNDCLTDKNLELKRKLIDVFSEGIKNLTNSNEFYGKFWGLALKKK